MVGRWERDRTAPEGGSMLMPLAWAPLLLLAAAVGPLRGLGDVPANVLLWLGLLLVGFALWRLQERRPLGRRNARTYLLLALLIAGLPLLPAARLTFPPAYPALLLWLGAVVAVQSTLRLERWVGPSASPLALRATGWIQDKGRPDLFLLRRHGVEATLLLDGQRAILDLRGATPSSSAPMDLGLHDDEEA